MIPVLILFLFVLCVVLIYVAVQRHRQKKRFALQIRALEEMIVQITRQQIVQSGQLHLAAELDETLRRSRAVLNEGIFGLNYELFDLLARHDLLGKKTDKP